MVQKENKTQRGEEIAGLPAEAFSEGG